MVIIGGSLAMADSSDEPPTGELPRQRVAQQLDREGHSCRIPAGDFKATCLKLMDRVKETGVEYVITKRNRPVARLAPVTDADLRPFVGRSRGVVTGTREDLMAPVGEDWEVDADL
jgi:prevent-host-death family protein